MKKLIWKILIVFTLLIIYTYINLIESIPNNITVFEGEPISLKTILGLKAYLTTEGDEQVIETISNNQTTTISDSGKNIVKVNLFENIFLKDISVDVLPKTKVIPVGSIAGIKLYTSGVLVVGMSEIEGIDSKKYKPYENTGIEEGDTIISINDNAIATTEELVQTVNLSDGNEIKIKYIHDEKTLECSIKPVQTAKQEYKLGLWVRDSAARRRDSYFL